MIGVRPMSGSERISRVAAQPGEVLLGLQQVARPTDRGDDPRVLRIVAPGWIMGIFVALADLTAVFR